MIRINKLDKPEYLTEEKIKELTIRYALEKSSVWNVKSIKDPLIKSSNNKCVYCECEVQTEDSYFEVEHFKPKGLYPNEVVNWSNLLPSCKRCNIRKGEHDVSVIPIINPSIENPREHLYIENYRYLHKDELGLATKDVLDLNEFDRLVIPRFTLSHTVAEKLDDIYQDILDYDDGNSYKTQRLYNKFNGILNQAQKDKPFTGVIATTIINSTLLNKIISFLESIGKYDENIRAKLLSVENYALI